MADRCYIEAEEQAVTWLTNAINSELFKDGYPGEIPAGAYNCWSFAITGGLEGTVPAACAVATRATVVGRYNRRQDALLLAGKLRTLFGVTLGISSIGGRVVSLRWVDEASFSREVIRPAGDQKDRQMWRVEIPLLFVFTTA